MGDAKDAAYSTSAKSGSRMQPVTFDGCFGWLHNTEAPGQYDTAIVLCAGLRREATNAHRAWRLLGDAAAAAGYSTLRFDYAGTGDSRDFDGAEHWGSWQRNIHAAIDWIRSNTGARRVILVGLRFGAALAAVAAAARDDVAGLLLLEPVPRGKSYVSQLVVEARLRDDSITSAEGGLTLDELFLSGPTLRQMAQLDLRDLALAPGCAVAMFSQSYSAVLTACAATWRDAGLTVACEDFTGLEGLLRPAHLADEPLPDFTAVLAWVRRQRRAMTTGEPRTLPAIEPAALRHDGCVETPLRFGPEGRLFGMLCCPHDDAPRDFAVIIGNAGGDPHHGFARFSVEFARGLARDRISSFRIDFAGLGDSMGLDEHGNECPTHAFDVDRSPDISAAIDALKRLGFRRFAVHGLCSGAYHAWHGAVSDDRIDMLLLINLPWFTLRHERPGPGSFARRSMAALSGRGVDLLLLFAEGDGGVKALEQHFGRGGGDLAALPGVTVSIDNGIDHDLTSNAIRRLASIRMTAFLREKSRARLASYEGV